MTDKSIATKKLHETIIDSIQDKKGIDIVSINLSKLDNSISNYFILCNGNSNTHVDSIADNVIEKVKQKHNEDVYHRDGFSNAQWIILDYFDIVVHIFQKEFRDFYNLDNLWADGEFERYTN